MKIDANQFALQLISNMTQREDETNKQYIKRALTLYLEADFLINDFNQLESEQFEKMKKRELNDLINHLIAARFN